jgi:hypothetical protein
MDTIFLILGIICFLCWVIILFKLQPTPSANLKANKYFGKWAVRMFWSGVVFILLKFATDQSFNQYIKGRFVEVKFFLTFAFWFGLIFLIEKFEKNINKKLGKTESQKYTYIFTGIVFALPFLLLFFVLISDHYQIFQSLSFNLKNFYQDLVDDKYTFGFIQLGFFALPFIIAGFYLSIALVIIVFGGPFFLFDWIKKLFKKR